MDTAIDQAYQPRRRNSYLGLGLLLVLITIVGVVSSITSYRVKSAERNRTIDLAKHYSAAGGNIENPLILRNAPLVASEQKLLPFLLVYEFNKLATAFGIDEAYTKVPAHNREALDKSFTEIGVDKLFGKNISTNIANRRHSSRAAKRVDIALSKYLVDLKN